MSFLHVCFNRSISARSWKVGGQSCSAEQDGRGGGQDGRGGGVTANISAVSGGMVNALVNCNVYGNIAINSGGSPTTQQEGDVLHGFIISAISTKVIYY